jgi:hypothetical protein
MRTIETTQATIAHRSAPTIKLRSRAKLRSAPTEDQGGFTRYARFTSCGATDGNCNCDYLLHDWMEASTLRTMITNTITSIIGLLMDTVQDSGAAIADRVGALHEKYNNPRRL